MTLIQDIIRKKRDGAALSASEIGELVAGITQNTTGDAQIAAFCMAVLLRGMSTHETARLTRAMAQSGAVLHWSDLNGPVIDKHSTGGIGDKTSLLLAPIASACGLYVPMIAGRGLGHTGGTIDKLESIPGFRTDLALEKFQHIVKNTGCAIIGQTGELAPADRRVYAVRDVTATVESMPLIIASILSKKIAAGLQGLVLDVKFGNGAFMQRMDQAEYLAAGLKETAQGAGLPLTPVLSDMNQPLGHAAGNAVEVQEAVDYLTGVMREARLHELTLHLGAEMLLLGKKATSLDEGKRLAQQALDSGRAADCFARMVAAQGGPADFIKRPAHYLPQAPLAVDIVADRDGVLNAVDTRMIGMVLVNLKAGRARADDAIDPAIGLTQIAPLGTMCEAGKTRLAQFHLREAASVPLATQSYLNCLTINATPYQATAVIGTMH